MISLETIEREINELEARGETTYSQCERLAWLYVCRDHLRPADGNGAAQRLGGSEFLDACDGKPYHSIMGIMDEHMSAIKIVYEREYQRVLDAVRAL